MISSRSLGHLFVVLLLIVPFVYKSIQWYDEFLVLLTGGLFLINRRANLAIYEKYMIWIIFFLGVVGLVSNYFSSISHNIFSILVDYFTLYKPFVIFICIRNLFTEDAKQVFIKDLVGICKVYIILNSILALLFQFVDLGFPVIDSRYGIKAYTFVFGSSMFPITILSSILIICFSDIVRKYFFIYLFMTFFCLIMTTKGTFIVFVIYLIFYYVCLRKKQFGLKYLPLFLIFVLFFSSFQLESYLLNEDSVRMLLLKGGFQTAKDFFPLGSGFGTYGTNEAAVNYSPLYYKYGFNMFYGMSEEDSGFLNDTYLAGIMGEEGFIGLLLFLILTFMLSNIIFKSECIDVDKKAIVVGAFLCLLVSMIATGIFKGISGFFLMSVIAVLLTREKVRV